MEVTKAMWTCRKCGHIWINRKPTKPIQCPKCRTYLWERELVEVASNKEEGIAHE